MSNFFSTQQPIEFDITIERNAIVETVVSTLNKMAEARFDGQNTQYVNNMQPEVDFEQDRKLVYGYYEDGIANIAQRIEPYVESCDEIAEEETEQEPGHVFHMKMPEEWRANQQNVLEKKMVDYLVHYVIAQWLEKVSVSDIEYTMDKAKGLLGKIKWTCELRKSKLHKVWNGTY